MKIFIATLGTRGDAQPYVALGAGLKKAGHSVTVCAARAFKPIVEERGLRYGHMNDDLLELMQTAEGLGAMAGAARPLKTVKTVIGLWKLSAPIQRKTLDEGWASAKEAEPDLILFHPKAFGGPHYAEKLGVPAFMAFYLPMYVPTAEYPNIGFPRMTLGGWYNRRTYTLVQSLFRAGCGPFVRKWRRANGLSPRRRLVFGEDIPVLHGFSRHVVPVPSDWPPKAAAAGFWFLDHPERWEPPKDLVDFLNAGGPPVYAGFGSMRGKDSERLAGIVIEAFRIAGVRGIIAKGWGGLNPGDLPPNVHAIGEAPHDWLFPKVSAAIHHGGAGTTAAALRAGRPSIVCPFLVLGDQNFWGRRVSDLGAGVPPLTLKRLTADQLAEAINKVTHEAPYRRNAEILGEKIRQEDGVGNAVEIIERWMETAKP